MTEYLTIISSIVAVTASISALILAWRKAPSESKKILAEAEQIAAETKETYQSMADKCADKISKQQLVIEGQAQQLAVLEQKIKDQNAAFESRLRAQEAETCRLNAGIVILISQLQSQDITPLWVPNK